MLPSDGGGSEHVLKLGVLVRVLLLFSITSSLINSQNRDLVINNILLLPSGLW